MASWKRISTPQGEFTPQASLTSYYVDDLTHVKRQLWKKGYTVKKTRLSPKKRMKAHEVRRLVTISRETATLKSSGISPIPKGGGIYDHEDIQSCWTAKVNNTFGNSVAIHFTPFFFTPATTKVSWTVQSDPEFGGISLLLNMNHKKSGMRYGTCRHWEMKRSLFKLIK